MKALILLLVLSACDRQQQRAPLPEGVHWRYWRLDCAPYKPGTFACLDGQWAVCDVDSYWTLLGLGTEVCQ